MDLRNTALEPKTKGPKKYKYYWASTDTSSSLVKRKFILG